ncbi:vitamin K epoxide reductase family protein [Pseudoxanthomonas mexicana]|uniref:vitamin K epoxide reductase family protein n=1 Tax=Pseudoxanthomonas mexicana TaxID=128785 RepID=UPI0009F93B16|nr:vitamin K epoxide reductase family protein [Pseudoxanthomonas mexicana]
MTRKKKRTAHRDRPASPAPRPATPPDRVMLALAVLGLLITGYLAWTAGSDSPSAFCTGDGGCDAIQRSGWSTLLGLPMALWGFGLYAVVVLVSLAPKASPLLRWQRQWRLVLLGLAISVYLTAVGAFVLDAFCVGCLASLAVLAAMFVWLQLRRPASAPAQPWGRWWAVQAVPVLLVVALLHVQQSGLLHQRPESRRAAALAQHLSDYGAKFYGASWCTECSRQKREFGHAADRLPYVECAPGGRSSPMTSTCASAGVTVFPTWVIDGIEHQGVMAPQQLAVLTRFDWDKAGATD